MDLVVEQGREGGEHGGGRGHGREGGEQGGGRCAVRVGESERIGLGFVRVAAYNTTHAAGRGCLGCHPFRPVKLVAKYFGPVYFQKAKLQIFLHFGPKIWEVNKAQIKHLRLKQQRMLMLENLNFVVTLSKLQ